MIDYNIPDYENNEKNTYETTSLDDWCRPNTKTNGNVGHIVFYIPGHEGNYQQARSLGAHGVNLSLHSQQLSREFQSTIRQKLSNGTMSKISDDVNNFVYDVYTVDFNGEGGAWHGSRLYAQVDFVVKAIERIAEQCGLTNGTNNDSITIVGHSIGGIVARKAVLTLHEKQSYENDSNIVKTNPLLVKHVITLASPHQFIPYVFDQSVVGFLEMVESDEKKLMKVNKYDTVLVSFSGGLRDELIPQQATYINHLKSDNHSILSAFASDVIPSRAESNYEGPRYGMDHRSIVWCHGLMTVLRELMHILVHSAHEPKTVRESQVSLFLKMKMANAGLNCEQSKLGENDENQCLDNDCSYKCRLKEKIKSLEQEMGFFSSVAMQSAMLYNLRLFTLVYTVNAVLYQIFVFAMHKQKFDAITQRISMSSICYFACPIISSSICIRFLSNNRLNIKSTILVLLSFAAMNLHHIIFYAIMPSVQWLVIKIKDVILKNGKIGSNGGHAVKWPLRSCISGQRRLFVVSLSVDCMLCLLQALVFGKTDWVFDGLAITSHLALIYNVSLMLFICYLGCFGSSIEKDAVSEDGEKKALSDATSYSYSSRIILHRRMICALLLPIFPLLVFGKMIYWSSLLTSAGRKKAVKYAQMAEFYLSDTGTEAKKSLTIQWLMTFISKYDLSFVFVVCFPLHAMLFVLQYLKLKYMTGMKSDAKKSR